MTTNSVPTTSCRGCPSMAAGTTYCTFSAPPTPYFLPMTEWCRVDTSGEAPSAHLSIALQLGLVPAPASPRTLTTIALKVTEACCTTAHSPSRPLPVGGLKGNPSLTVSAPNRSKRGKCCRTRTRDRPGIGTPDSPPTDPAAWLTCPPCHDPGERWAAPLPRYCERCFRRVLPPASSAFFGA